MARRIQQLSIDGVNVDLSKARFADTFDVAESDERRLAFDEEVVYVVIARVSTPSFRESKNGEVSRVNVLKVKEARLVKDEQFKDRLLGKVGFDYSPVPSLFDGLEEAEEVETQAPQSVEDLEEQGVRFIRNEPEDPEYVPDEDLDAFFAEDEEPDIDPELAEFLALTRRINDELEDDEDVPAAQPTQTSRGLDARGARATDPVLDRFLQ